MIKSWEKTINFLFVEMNDKNNSRGKRMALSKDWITMIFTEASWKWGRSWDAPFVKLNEITLNKIVKKYDTRHF